MYKNFHENILLSDYPVRQFGKPVMFLKVSGLKEINDLLLKVFF